MRETFVRTLMWSFVFSVSLAIAPGRAAGQENMEEMRRQYEQQIEHLQRQLDELREQQERMLQQMDRTTAPSPEIETRLQEIEEKMEEAEAEKDPGTLRFYWKEGLRMDSNDGNFKLKLGGRIQNDWGWFSLGNEIEDAGLDAESGTEFRRARFEIEGEIYRDFIFKAQYDFAGGDSDFKDVFMGAKNLPVPGLSVFKVGHFKEPFSLEELTSSKYTTFMEYALPNVFAPGRNTGFAVYGKTLEDRLGYAAGWFLESDDFGSGSDNSYNVTGRIWGVPWYEEDGRNMVHVGVGATHKDVDDNFRYRQRPEAHLTDRFVNTGTFPVDSVDTVGLEAALVYGPFSVQGEYMFSSIEAASSMYDADMSGGYVQVSYFVTGEHRPYKLGDGVFDKVKPKKNFGFGSEDGWGAWELAARYSILDLEDDDINGGEEWNITLGMNWYLNPNMRIMLNYIHAEIDRDEGIFDPLDSTDSDDFIPAYDDDFDAIMARFQVFW